MRKKSQRKRLSNHRSNQEQPHIVIIRYLIYSIVFLVLGVLIYPILTKHYEICANSISCKTPPKLEIDNNAVGVYNNQPIKVPNISMTDTQDTNPVLGVETPTVEKHIYVNLDTQTLTAYEGDKLFMQTPISSGLWGKTPKGTFTIWSKFRATRMSGGSGADYYDLPNVPFVMFFSNNEVPGSAGFSLHGTYWHNNFGHTMSHGCVNMKTTDAEKMFNWTDGPMNGNPGTTITIYDGLSTND